MSRKQITIEDLILIFGEDFVPPEIDKKILMKHFEVGSNRVIGEKTIDKLKKVLITSIEAAKADQFKVRGGVINSPFERLKPQDISSTKESIKSPASLEEKPTEKKVVEDKYGLSSIKSGLVSKRLEKRTNGQNSLTKKTKAEEQTSSAKLDDSTLPSVEDLTVLSGGQMIRDEGDSIKPVKKEVAIREYQALDESRSIRWGKEFIRDREGKTQEINNPSYIFHSDLWQFEEAQEQYKENRCDILQHAVLDMLANNINVVMLENETEPFFVVEGFGLLKSKDSLKDKISIHEQIQLIVISSEAWQIALKKPEAMIRGIDRTNIDKSHSIDMTSVVPLANVRTKIVGLDNKFKIEFREPNPIMDKALHALQNHRKNVIWSCGAPTIANLREAVNSHKAFVDKPQNSLNMVVIGTNQTFHPIKIKFDASGNFTVEELFPGYCKKHSILSAAAIKDIFGCIPAIYDSSALGTPESEVVKIAESIHKRLGYSAIEAIFDLGYIIGNANDVVPLSKLDIILPLPHQEMQQKMEQKGFNFIFL
ncbi:MAG: hypothetical protein ACTSPM_08590 [Candidatus Heimdallarchaeota archaeon]